LFGLYAFVVMSLDLACWVFDRSVKGHHSARYCAHTIADLAHSPACTRCNRLGSLCLLGPLLPLPFPFPFPVYLSTFLFFYNVGTAAPTVTGNHLDLDPGTLICPIAVV
jgi:hypothetical protein